MARIDKDLALRLMMAGDADSKIAAVFGTTRQAVNLLRQSLVAKGVLTVPATPRQERHRLATLHPVPLGAPPTQHSQDTAQAAQSPAPARPTLEQLTDWMIHIIKDAGESRQLRRECESARATIETLQAQILKLRQELTLLTERPGPDLRRARELEAAIERTELPSTQPE